MDLTVPENTLQYHLQNRPLTVKRDLSWVVAPEVAAAMQDFWADGIASGDKAKPESCALMFYMTNHGLALIRQRIGDYDALDKYGELVDAYYERGSEMATRMFYYLLLICMRESRHLQSTAATGQYLHNQGLTNEAVSFMMQVVGQGSGSVVSSFLKHPPNCPIGDIARATQMVFYKGKFAPGYGGKNWGRVADCLVEFVFGRYSGDMMLDVGFTLAHNNGPIFNKGMLYQQYGSELRRILDVQRSGQIPQMIANGETGFAKGDLKLVHKQFEKILGEEFGGYVDWFVVEALGALGKYPKEQEAQVAKHGKPETKGPPTVSVMPATKFSKPIAPKKMKRGS